MIIEDAQLKDYKLLSCNHVCLFFFGFFFQFSIFFFNVLFVCMFVYVLE